MNYNNQKSDWKKKDWDLETCRKFSFSCFSLFFIGYIKSQNKEVGNKHLFSNLWAVCETITQVSALHCFFHEKKLLSRVVPLLEFQVRSSIKYYNGSFMFKVIQSPFIYLFGYPIFRLSKCMQPLKSVIVVQEFDILTQK